MKQHLLIKLLFTLSALIFIVSCAKSIEGTYTITKSPYDASSVQGVTLTLGKDTFVFSTGRSGKYEVSDGKIIFSSPNFSEVMKIEGDELINDKYIFKLQR